MPARASLADLGVRIGALPAGPTNSVLDVPGIGLGHATVVRDEPDPPAGAGVARTGVTVLDPGGRRVGPADPGRGRGAQRRRRAHRPLAGGGVGAGRDPRVLDGHHAGRPGVRRGLPAADGRAAGDRRRRRGDPGGGRVRRLVAERPSGRPRQRRARGGRLVRGARLGRLAGAARAGGRGCGHRDDLPRLEGRHRHVVAGPARRACGRGPAAVQLRPVGPAHLRRRRGGPRPRPPRPPGAAARRLLPRRRGDRRPARRGGVRAAGPAGRPRPRAGRLHRPPLLGRAVPRAGDRPARRTGRRPR